MFGKSEEPEAWEVQGQRQPTSAEAMAQQHRKSVSNKGLTGASSLTVRQSIWPITLVTVLFFLWGFAVSSELENTDPSLEVKLTLDVLVRLIGM